MKRLLERGGSTRRGINNKMKKGVGKAVQPVILNFLDTLEWNEAICGVQKERERCKLAFYKYFTVPARAECNLQRHALSQSAGGRIGTDKVDQKIRTAHQGTTCSVPINEIPRTPNELWGKRKGNRLT
jgi:hypothetical protein